MRHIALSIFFCLALASCQQDKGQPSASQQKSPTPASSSTSTSPSASGGKEGAIKLPPAPALAPSTTFSDVPSCMKAGYNDQQCSQAYSIASAMHNADAPKYNSVSECEQFFKNCSKSDKGKTSPAMAAFSVAGQKKGVYTAPSRENPLFLLPLYTAKDGKLVEVKTVMGKMVLLPLGETLPAPQAPQAPQAQPAAKK